MDETYVKIRGRWTYVYRAADVRSKAVDFRLSSKRDVATTRDFLRRAQYLENSSSKITEEETASRADGATKEPRSRGDHDCRRQVAESDSQGTIHSRRLRIMAGKAALKIWSSVLADWGLLVRDRFGASLPIHQLSALKPCCRTPCATYW